MNALLLNSPFVFIDKKEVKEKSEKAECSLRRLINLLQFMIQLFKFM